MHPRTFRFLSPALGAAMVLSVAVTLPGPASAAIEGLTVFAARDIGTFRGKAYREIEARMEGSASGGAYAVPVTFTFPKQASEHNGFAVVDVVNTVTIGKEQFVVGGRPLPLARLHMGEDFLFGNGNAYIAVIWDKSTVEALGSGTIAAVADGYTVLRDAAALARNPAGLLPVEAGGAPPASGKVVVCGYSQTGSLLRGWYAKRLNSGKGGALTFDGALVAGASGGCKDLDPLGDAICEGPLADGGKVIVLSPESDAEWNGYVERGETADYRVIEIASVSHIPASAADFRGHGLPEQNLIDFGPAFRAALVNLQAWLNSTDPPPGITIDLTDEAPLGCPGRILPVGRPSATRTATRSAV